MLPVHHERKEQSMEHRSAQSRQTLDRSVGPLALLFTAVTVTIGSGWLFASMYAAQMAGPAAIFSWLIGGVVTLVLALVYAELGAMIPLAGAVARVPHFSHGTINSFMAGWLCWIAYITTATIEVTGILDYTSNYLEWLTIDEHGERVLTPYGIGTAALLMLVFTVINMLGVKWFARANITVTFWKLIVPILVSVILISEAFQPENFFEHGGFAPNGIAGVFGAVSSGGVMFCLFGFRTIIDMAGEARNPQRNVPLTMIAGVVICVAIYTFLQVAFVGVIPSDHLRQGWAKISAHVAAGPFAAFASVLGLQWLALTLYCDAILSPAGSGLGFMGAAARINYAMSKNRQLPAVFEKLNRFKVPVWSLLFNFLVGMLMFLPFPGWAELAGFISSAVVLSLAFGPVSLAALRYQVPGVDRPFRIPFGIVFSAVAFVLVGFVVYWTGWETNWKVLLAALIGFVFMGVERYTRSDAKEPLNLRESIWIWPYLVGLGTISYLGSYGRGLGIVPHGADLVLVAAFSLAVFALAVKCRLKGDEARRLIMAAREQG